MLAGPPAVCQSLGVRRQKDCWGSPVRPFEMASQVRIRRPARHCPPASSKAAGGVNARFTAGPRSTTRSMGQRPTVDAPIPRLGIRVASVPQTGSCREWRPPPSPSASRRLCSVAFPPSQNNNPFSCSLRGQEHTHAEPDRPALMLPTAFALRPSNLLKTLPSCVPFPASTVWSTTVPSSVSRRAIVN